MTRRLALLPEWTEELSLQQQAVLIMALRGPDGFPKFHASKRIVRLYRGCLMRSGHKQRFLEAGELVGTFMSLDFSSDNWESAMGAWASCEDELPVHFYSHLMHGAQVLAYKYPDKGIRIRWLLFYEHCCDYLHVEPETEEAMDQRLNDFGQFTEE